TNKAPVVLFINPLGDEVEGGRISAAPTVQEYSWADVLAGLSFHWEVTRNGVPYVSPTWPNYSQNWGNIEFFPDDSGTYVLTVTATDKDGGSGSGSLTLSIANAPPVPAILGAPASSPEGTAISLTASATDPGGADVAAGFSYTWAVTKNGSAYTGGSGANFSFTPDDNGTYAVTLTATDKDGATGTTTTTIAVTNAAPIAAIAGASGGVRGQDLGFTLSATDPSPIDQAAGFDYTVNWGDGTNGTASGSGSGVNLSHTYTASGTYSVQVTARDKDGVVSSVSTKTLTVVAAQIQGDALFVGGTTGTDR